MGTDASDDGKLELLTVNPGLLDFCWDEVRPLLARSCAYSEECSVDQMRVGILNGQYQLYVIKSGGAVVGVAAVQIVQHPQFKAAHIAALAGKGLVGHPTLLHAFKAEMKAIGCSRLQFVARPSAARLYRQAGLTSDKLFFREAL